MRARLRQSRWFVAATIVVALAGSWYACNRYRSYPLKQLPSVDLSFAHPAVKAAIDDARKAVIAAPHSGAAWGELGLYLRAHEFDSEANICFAQAMRFDPQEVLWPYVRGSSLSVRDRPLAENDFRLAAQLRPDLALPRLRLAEMHLEERRLSEAETEYEAAIRIEPENARAMLGLALVAFARGDLATAQHLAERSFARDPDQRTTAELLVRVFSRLGDKAAASRSQALLDTMPPGESGWDDPLGEKVLQRRRDPAGMSAAAGNLLARGRTQEAIAVLEHLVSAAPETAQWPDLLARALIQQKDFRRATQVLDAAIARHPLSADVHFQRGVVSFFSGQWQPAAVEFRRAIELKPDFSDAHYNLGHTLIHLDDRAAAMDEFREAIRFRPDYAAAHTNLGELLIEAGQRDEGREALEAAARLAPDDQRTRQLLDRSR
jgi:tetratricopeptide (TPR) repeat protein